MKIFNNLEEANDYARSFIDAVPNNIFVNDLISVHFKKGNVVYVFSPDKIIRIIEQLMVDREIMKNKWLNRPAPTYPEIINEDSMSLDFNLKLHFSLPETQINKV